MMYMSENLINYNFVREWNGIFPPNTCTILSVTRQMQLVKQKLFTLSEHPMSLAILFYRSIFSFMCTVL